MGLHSRFRLRHDERGATMVEYALLACCIAVVLIASVTMVGREAYGTFNTVRVAAAGANNPQALPPIPSDPPIPP